MSQVTPAPLSSAAGHSAPPTRAPSGSDPRGRSSRSAKRAGHLYSAVVAEPQRKVNVSDSALADCVVDNLTKWDPTETETLIIGTGFGTTPDIQQGADGNLYVLSITDAAIYKISRQ